MREFHYTAVAALSALVLSSCSGGDNGPSGPTNPGQPDTPHPESVTVTTDPSRMASARISTSGGSVQATGADGTIYTLTIPPDALVADTTVTMTPITGASGLEASSGRLLGVQLEPDGLRFFNFATLTFSPPEGPRHQAFAFSAHGTGTELHRVPLTPDPDILEVKLLHFSPELALVAGPAEGTFVAAPTQGLSPTEWEDRAQAQIAQIFQDERDRLARGEEIDPERGEKLQAILQEYWDKGVEPTLDAMMTDCQATQKLAPRALTFEKTVELLGFHDHFESQEGQVHGAVVAALENCFRQTVGECLKSSDTQKIKEAAGYSRSLALMGIEDPEYNVANPDLYCNGGWIGTATRSLKLNGDALTDVITTEVEWEVDSANTHPGVVTQYRVKSGTMHWEQKGTDQDGCTHVGGPQSFDLTPQDGVIVKTEGQSPTYQATGMAVHYTQVTITCPPTMPSYTSDVSVSDWLVTPVVPLDARATELAGTYQFGDITYTWQFRP
jgi:hypothetical protein